MPYNLMSHYCNCQQLSEIKSNIPNSIKVKQCLLFLPCCKNVNVFKLLQGILLNKIYQADIHTQNIN